MNKSLHNLHYWLVNNHFYKEASFISSLNKYASLNQRQLTLFIQSTFPELFNSDQISDRLFNLFKGLRDVDSFNQMISSQSQEQLEPFVSKLEQVYPQVKSRLDKVLPQNLAETQARIYIVKFYKDIDAPSFLSNLNDLQSKEDFFSLMKGIKKEKQISSIFEGKNTEGLSQLELQWIEKVYNDPSEAHSVDDILSLVRTFKRDQERFDKKITDFGSYAEATKYLDSKSGISEHAYMESIRVRAQSNNMSKIVYEDEQWKVVAIGSTIAGQYWRYATRSDPNMCIGTLTNNMFPGYGIERNLDIYFIIDKVNSGPDNPMRMFSLAMARDYNDIPILSHLNSTMTNALNKGISISDIENQLGSVYEDIYNAIMQDSGSRRESLGRENAGRLNNLIKDRDSALSNIKQIKIYFRELFTDEENVRKSLRFGIDELEHLIANYLAENGSMIFFESILLRGEEIRLNKKYPDLERVLAEKWADSRTVDFFRYELNKKYPDLERIVAEKWTEEGNDNFYYFRHKLAEKYPDLDRIIAEKWANEGEEHFLHVYGLDKKHPDLERVIAEKWANEGDKRFFQYKLNNKYSDLERVIAEKWANAGQGYFFFIEYSLDKKYPDLEMVIAEKWANNGDQRFFQYKLNNKYSDLERVIAEKWANAGQGYFFHFQLNKKYPDLERVIAETWVNDGIYLFFKYKLNEKYKDLEEIMLRKVLRRRNI